MHRIVLWLAMAALLLAGCSMSTEYFINQSLRDAGFSRSESRCAVDGVAAHLTQDQLWSLRGPLVGYIMLDNPPEPLNVDDFLAWLGKQVSPEIHHVVAHYATHCRLPAQLSGGA